MQVRVYVHIYLRVTRNVPGLGTDGGDNGASRAHHRKEEEHASHH